MRIKETQQERHFTMIDLAARCPNPEAAQAFDLYLQGYTANEIADKMNMSSKRVEKTLQKFRSYARGEGVVGKPSNHVLGYLQIHWYVYRQGLST
jgi:hypothetical protein